MAKLTSTLTYYFAVVVFPFCSIDVCLAQIDDEEQPETDINRQAFDSIANDKIDIPSIYFGRGKGAPVIDGYLNEPFWLQAESFSIDTEIYPTRLAKAIVDTDVKIVVTDTHIYLGFIAYDPDINDIRSAPRERDGTKNDDYVSIVVDPTGQSIKKYEFRVNPHGSPSDILQDSVSDRYSYDWDAKWEGSALILPGAYQVEIAIPFSAIKLPENYESSDAKWILILKRNYPRQVYRTLGTVLYAKTLRTDKAAINSVAPTPQQATSIELVPHYIYHMDKDANIGEPLERSDDHRLNEVGLDARINLSSSRRIGITVNPNFTEVEADIARQSINNPFNVFKPEKRRFFQNDMDLYSSLTSIVYSRNILKPKYGMAYADSMETSSSGAFWVHDEKTQLVMPDNLGSDTVETDTLSRSAAMRYQQTSDKKTTGVLATFRNGDNYQNAVASVDGILNVGLDDKFRYQFMYSTTLYPERFADDLCETSDCTESPPPSDCPPGGCPVNPYVLRANYGETLNDYALQLKYKHDGPDSLYWVDYYNAAPDFRADLGFVRRVDYRSLDIAYGRKWYVETLQSDKGESRLRAYLVGTRIESHAGHQLNNGLSAWGEFRGTFQTAFRLGRRYQERAVNRLDQSSLEIEGNAPLFQENYWQWYFEVAPDVNWTMNLDGRRGEMADPDNMVLGDMDEVIPKLTYRIDNIEAMLSATLRDFELDGSRLYLERFLSLTLTYRRDKQLSHRLLILDDTTERDLSRFVGDELAEEKARTLEYTLTYKPRKKWSFLAGFKFEQEDNSEVSAGGITNREAYFKVEYQFERKVEQSTTTSPAN